MWVFLNNAMVSIVAHRTKPDHLLCRARIRGDLQRVFPGHRVTRTPDADYLYRCVVSRTEVALELSAAVAAIEYPNFKGSIPASEPPQRARAYHRAWDAMMDAQVDLEPGTGGYLAPTRFFGARR
jgi:hypothetical protein